MKVARRVRAVSAIGRNVVTVALSAVFVLMGSAAPAHAITRAEVLARANTWIKKRVPYSQSSYYDGYRQDCSGFVSMAWKLKSSYTSSDIGSTATRISVNSLKPGDAVRRSGHVEIFDGWKNKKQLEYWALEESTWGKPALKAVKRFKSGYSALRRRGLLEAKPKPKAKLKPKPVAPPPSTTATPSPSADASGSADSSGSVPTSGTPAPSVPATGALAPDLRQLPPPNDDTTWTPLPSVSPSVPVPVV